METRFDYAEHEPYAKNGENGMNGRGFINEQGKDITCAGNRVLLLPGTFYFQEMIGHITAGSEPLPPETPHPSLKGMIRRTQCDAEGKFSFSELPAGRWFVLTQVNGAQTTVLIGEVTVLNGTTVPVLLTDRHIVGR